MLEVYFVQWGIGLNPYNYLQECFGGAISLQDENKLIFPEGALIRSPHHHEYLKVRRPKQAAITQETVMTTGYSVFTALPESNQEQPVPEGFNSVHGHQRPRDLSQQSGSA